MVLGIFIGAFGALFLTLCIVSFSKKDTSAKYYQESNDLLRLRVENGERAACALEKVVAHFTSANSDYTAVFVAEITSFYEENYNTATRSAVASLAAHLNSAIKDSQNCA